MPCTRLVATCIDGKPKGAIRFIDFDTGIEGMPRDELYDYDFDIDKWRSTSGEDEVHMVLISGKRAGAGLASAATNLVFTTLRIAGKVFVAGNTVIEPSKYPGSMASFSRKGCDMIGYKPDYFHSIMSLQVTALGRGGFSSLGNYTSLVTFLDRCAPTAEKVLSTSAEVEVRIGIKFESMRSGGKVLTPSQRKLPRPYVFCARFLASRTAEMLYDPELKLW